MGIVAAIQWTFNRVFTYLLGALGSGGAAAYYGAYAVAAVVTSAVVYGTSRAVGRALAPDIPSGRTGVDPGVRTQVAPNTGVSVPISYGKTFTNGIVTDAYLSSNNQQMTYVITLSEKTSGSTTLSNVYFNDKRLVFSGDENVTSTVDEDGTTSTDFAGNVKVWVWDGSGDAANIIQGSSTDAYNVVSGWANSSYAGSDTIFSVVQITYDPEAQLTGLGTMTYELTNSLDNPANVIVDYLNNPVFGANISNSEIDMDSISTLYDYSNELISYTDKNGANATQKRYTINGIANTAEDVRTNLDRLLTACNSFFTYDVKKGKWKVIPNKAESNATLANAFVFSDDNIFSDLKFSTTELNGSYNSIEVEYPDGSQKDKNNYATVDLPSALRETNEVDNQMKIRYEFVNNNVQAEYLANQELRQNREDLVVTFEADYSALSVDAGDVVKLYVPDDFGQNNKLYRVLKTTEKATEEGMISIEVTALEYNEDVYTVEPITEFTPAPNSDITLFNRLTAPSKPTVDNEQSLTGLPTFDVNTTTASSGIYTLAELWYSTDSGFANSSLLQRKETPTTFGNGTEVEFQIRGLDTGTYYYKARTGNDRGMSSFSTISDPHVWTANVLINPTTIVNTSINNNTITVLGNSLVVGNGSISNTYLDANVIQSIVDASNASINAVSSYFYFDSAGNTNAPNTSVFFSQVGRNPIDDDIVVVTNTSNTLQQAGYVYDTNAFVLSNNFFSGSIITDGTIGANKIVAGSISTSELNFTPVTEVAGATGSTISAAQLSSGGVRLQSQTINLGNSDVTGTLPVSGGGTGQSNLTLFTADLSAEGLRLRSEQINIANSDVTGTLPVASGGTGQTSTASYVADLSAEGLRLRSETINLANSDVSGTLAESNGGTGATVLDNAYFTAKGVRLTSVSVPASDLSGQVAEGNGGTGTTSFSAALTAQGVGFVSGVNQNLGDLATLDTITRSYVTDFASQDISTFLNAGSLATANNVNLASQVLGTLGNANGGTGFTTDSAYASHLGSQGLIVTEVAGGTGAVSAATIISAGSILVADANVSRNASGGVTQISGGVITTGTLDASLVNVTNLNANNITTGQLTADRIDVTDLTLEVEDNTVSGITIGGFLNNTLRLKQVGAIGTEPGIYSGYVKVFGGSGQVKTLAIAVGDGTYGSTASGADLKNDIEYDQNNDVGNNSIPIATTGYAQFASGISKHWCQIDRFASSTATAHLSVTFRKTSANTTTSYLYINAQGDTVTRYLGNVEYAFYRFSEI